MTVENYTAWMRMDRPEMAMFYLGGYTTRKQRDFFKKFMRIIRGQAIFILAISMPEDFIFMNTYVA